MSEMIFTYGTGPLCTTDMVHSYWILAAGLVGLVVGAVLHKGWRR
jgi:hypothetical protein